MNAQGFRKAGLKCCPQRNTLALGPVDTVTRAGGARGGKGRIFLDINRPHVCSLEARRGLAAERPLLQPM